MVQELAELAGYVVFGRVLPIQVALVRVLEENDRPSGDWIGAKRLDAGSLVVVAADLMGDGSGAGPYHDRLERYLKSIRDACPVAFIHGLHSQWPEDRFVSLGVVAIDTRRGEFRLALAGHPDPILRRDNAHVSALQSARLGLVGAHLADIEAVPTHVFAPGDSLVLVSDGVVDAGFSQGERFGMKRLIRAVRAAQSTRQICGCLFRQLFRHLNGGPAEDDMSVLIVHRNAVPAVACEAVGIRRAA